MGEASRKVEGGKMVNVRVENGNVKLTGDFFMHPEEAIEGLETAIEGSLGGDVENAVRVYLEDEGVELLGVSPHDIAATVKEAAE